MSYEPIKCALCDYRGHTLAKHVWEAHNVNPVDYTLEHGALLSPYGVAKMKELMMKPFETKTMKANDLFPDWKQAFSDDNVIEVGVNDHPLIPTLDPDYSFPEDAALEVMTLMEKPLRNNLWVQGPTQCGKTKLIRNLAAKLRRPLFEITCNVHMTPQHFFGKTRARAGETFFNYGIVPKWMRTPGAWFLANEWDTLDTECTNALKSCLEFPRRICLTEHDDEMIYGHPDNRFIVCCNTRGRGDDTGMFINTQVQSIADLARFNGYIEIDYIGDEQEKALLSKMFPDVPAKAIENIVNVANKTREKFKQGGLTRVISTAEAINWCENYTLFYTGHHSARVSFLNGYDDVAKTAVRELINNAFGQEDSEVLNDARTAARAADKATDEG